MRILNIVFFFSFINAPTIYTIVLNLFKNHYFNLLKIMDIAALYFMLIMNNVSLNNLFKKIMKLMR